MSAIALKVARRSNLRRELILGASVGCFVAVFTIGLVAVANGGGLITGLAVVLLLAILVGLVLSPRLDRSMIGVMLYIGLLDGFIKLRFYNPATSLIRDFLLYAVVVGIIARAVMNKQSISVPPWTGWVLVFAGVVFIQAFNPNSISLPHALASMREELEWVPLFFIGYRILRSTERLRLFLMLLLGIAAMNGVISAVQYNETPSQLASWGPGYQARVFGTGTGSAAGAGTTYLNSAGVLQNRPFALGSDNNFAGPLGVLAITCALALIPLSRGLKSRLLIAVLAAGEILLLVTAQSRSGIVGAAAAVLVYFLLVNRSRRAVASVASLAVIGVLAYGVVAVAGGGSSGRYISISPTKVVSTFRSSRGPSLSLFPRYLAKYPLGAGIGRTGPAQTLGDTSTNRGAFSNLDAENEFNFLLLDVGIPGLLVLTGFVIVVLAAGVKRIRATTDEREHLLLAALVAPEIAIALSWFGAASPTTATPTAPYFWLLAGALAWWTLPQARKLRAAS